jgi:hypothetical protein
MAGTGLRGCSILTKLGHSMRATALFVLPMVSLLAAALACSGKSSPATDADGGPCDQACMDTHTGVALVQLVDQLYNVNLASKAPGNQMATVSCPQAGTAVISGTTSVDASQTTTLNLTYVMSGCAVVDNGDNLTFAGTVIEVGSFDSASEESLEFTSSALQFDGVVSGAAVDVPGCPVHAADDWTSNPQISGTICGRSF